MSLWFLIQYFGIGVLIVFLVFYTLVVLAIRRAGRPTTLSIPLLWKLILGVNLFLIVATIAFILVT